MARYSEQNFQIASETQQLIQGMAEAGKLDNLVAERVWQELLKALGEPSPERFFETLRELGVLVDLFPEIDALWGVPQPHHWHPEVDCGVHTMMALAAASRLSDDLQIRFAVLTHDLGKATTPEEILPSHHGHEARGAQLCKHFCQRLKAPSSFCDLAKRCTTYHTYMHHLYELRPKTILKLLQGLDAFRRRENLDRFVQVCQADYQGRKGFTQRPYPQARDLISAYEAALEVEPDGRPELAGPMLGEAIRRARIVRIAEVMSSIKRNQT
jgi:tRNA nucleotidyltransferase (CCA-adding enzyme)